MTPIRPALLRAALALGATAVFVPSAPAQQASAARTVDHLVRSSALPEAEVRVSGDLAYLGPVRYPVGNGALVEAFVFADTADGQLRRAFVAHFEGYPDSVDGSFRYPRLEMATLGGHEYLNQTWAFRGFALFDLPAIRELLERHGIAVARDWLVDRYVRVVDPAEKHEVIFFYLESGSINDPSIVYSAAGTGRPPVPPPAVAAALRERARRTFEVRVANAAHAPHLGPSP
jgi:hypothetical protein